jgi:hypothetical protein
MFFGVVRRNVVTGGDDQIFRIIKGMQIVDVDVSDVEGYGGSKGENDSQALTMSEILVPPPSVDSGKLSYVQREQRSTRLSISRNKAPKRKAKKNNSLSKIQNTKDELKNVNMQVDEDF